MKNRNQWFCGVEGQQFGPFTWEQMRGMAAEGRIVSESFVRRDVDQQWFQASQIPGLLPKAQNSGSSSTIGKVVGGATVEGKAIKATNPQTSAGASRSKASEVATVPTRSVVDKAPLTKAKPSVAVVPKGVARGIPVGQALEPSPPVALLNAVAPIVLQATPPAFVRSPTVDAADRSEPVKKGSNAIILVAALGGVAAVVGVVGVGLIVWNSMRPAAIPATPPATALTDELAHSIEQAAAELEGNPLTPEVDPQASVDEVQSLVGEITNTLPTRTSEGEAALPAAASRSTPTLSPAAAKLVASIPSWTSVVNLRGIALNNLRLQVASAWLAADEKGTRVEPATEGQSDPAAQFVFIEVRITNTAPVVRKYKSWNASTGTSVVLANQANQVLALVPPASTPQAVRLTEVSIAPGESVTDQLVFVAPAGNIEKLRLALAKSALAEGAKFKSGSHFALEIPLEVLLTQASSGPQAPVVEGTALANQAPASSASTPRAIIATTSELPPGSDKPSEVAASEQPAMKKADKPPSPEELNRQFEELSKMEGKDEEIKKKGEAQK